MDVYSFGTICWELFTGTLPLKGKTEIASNLNKQEVTIDLPEIPINVPSDISAMITSCWKLNPEDRPTFVHCVSLLEQHMFLE